MVEAYRENPQVGNENDFDGRRKEKNIKLGVGNKFGRIWNVWNSQVEIKARWAFSVYL